MTIPVTALVQAPYPDMFDRVRVETLLRDQKQILSRAATGAPLLEILRGITQIVESHDPGLLCSVLLLDSDAVHLRLGAANSLPDVYNHAIDGIRIGPSVGSCGTAAFTRQRVLVEDIAEDPLWADFRDLALHFGLRACWSSPALAEDGKVLGTVAIYSREPGLPSPFQLELLETATYLAGIAMQRDRAEKEAATRAGQQRAVAELGVRAFADVTLDQWMQEVTETVARTLDVEFCKVLELLPTGEVFLKAGVGWKEGLVGSITVPTGNNSQAGYTLMVDEPVIVEDLQSDPRFSGPALLTEHGVISGISVIVYQGEGRRWGAMGAHSRRRKLFTKDDVAFFQNVANLMGLVLEREKQREELERNAREITDLNQRLRRSLAETHHRVKNNLQVISAMVEMQVTRDDKIVPVSEIHRLGQHVRGLAAIHDLLTEEAKQTGQVENLSASDALERLTPMLQTVIGERRLDVQVEEAVETVRLPIRQSAGLAILVNELVSNANKHGRGDISVRLGELPDRPGWASLEVRDDGPGFPPDFDPQKAANTGLELIESVGRWDLRGEISYENRPEGGASVIIRFPAEG